ncbi:MAG: hypothetical protein WBB34_21705 [Xanthobacteraceae bacterium]
MNFKEATDGLFDRISHEELADALGVSVALIRQSRLNQAANAYRNPPQNWQSAVVRLAEKRIMGLNAVIKGVRDAR